MSKYIGKINFRDENIQYKERNTINPKIKILKRKNKDQQNELQFQKQLKRGKIAFRDRLDIPALESKQEKENGLVAFLKADNFPMHESYKSVFDNSLASPKSRLNENGPLYRFSRQDGQSSN